MDEVIDDLIDAARLKILPGLLSLTPRPGGIRHVLFEQAFEPFGIPPQRVRLQSQEARCTRSGNAITHMAGY